MVSHQPGVWPVFICVFWTSYRIMSHQPCMWPQWSVPDLKPHGISPARCVTSVQWNVPNLLFHGVSLASMRQVFSGVFQSSYMGSHRPNFSGVFPTSYLMVCNQPGMWPECTVEHSQPLISPCLINQVWPVFSRMFLILWRLTNQMCDQSIQWSVPDLLPCDVSSGMCKTGVFSEVVLGVPDHVFHPVSPLGVWPRCLVE